MVGRFAPAAEQLRQALDLFQEVADPAGRARAVGVVGNVESRQGNHRAAADHIRQAMVLYRRIGDTIGEARNLGGLAIVEARLGHYEAAARGHERTLL
jgi:tetratricopeptide (TPR) repeat protein